jgi:hypothetical protein
MEGGGEEQRQYRAAKLVDTWMRVKQVVFRFMEKSVTGIHGDAVTDGKKQELPPAVNASGKPQQDKKRADLHRQETKIELRRNWEIIVRHCS